MLVWTRAENSPPSGLRVVDVSSQINAGFDGADSKPTSELLLIEFHRSAEASVLRCLMSRDLHFTTAWHIPQALFIQVPLLCRKCWKLNSNILNLSIHFKLNSAACVLYWPIRECFYSRKVVAVGYSSQNLPRYAHHIVHINCELDVHARRLHPRYVWKSCGECGMNWWGLRRKRWKLNCHLFGKTDVLEQI